MMVNSEYTGERARAEYNWPPPNPKYADSPEYRAAPRYTPPPHFEAAYQPPATAYYQPATGPSLLSRLLWFVFVGWWLGILWTIAGYGLCGTIIGLPLGLYMLNRLPQILTLQPSSQPNFFYSAETDTFQTRPVQQINFFLRAVYYLFAGWWLGILWTMAAYTLCVLLVTLPLGVWMLNRLPLVMTLRQN